MLKRDLKKCIDWSKIDKRDYLSAMQKSVTDFKMIYRLLESALTDDINNKEVIIKGIDYSYYYESEE